MKLDNFFEMSYVINLTKRPDRLKNCEDAWYKLNFYPERFAAIENKNPALGCYLSHLEILRRARDANKNVLIFEDDVEVINFENHLMERVMDELYNLDWAMIYLGGNILRPFYQETNHLAKLSHCQSTHSYGISKKYLPQIVDFLENNIHIIDCLYADYVVPQLPCYVTIPMMTRQRTDYSDIEKQVMTYDIPMERYNRYLVRREGMFAV
jgi:GR25 family glycosyltransferase involved in LPS biosynthesis